MFVAQVDPREKPPRSLPFGFPVRKLPKPADHGRETTQTSRPRAQAAVASLIFLRKKSYGPPGGHGAAKDNTAFSEAR